jgi:hypothetical protein
MENVQTFTVIAMDVVELLWSLQHGELPLDQQSAINVMVQKQVI